MTHNQIKKPATTNTRMVKKAEGKGKEEREAEGRKKIYECVL